MTTFRFALTPGEPAGIGPDLAVIQAQQSCRHELVAFADPVLLRTRAKDLGLPLRLRKVDLSAPPRQETKQEATLKTEVSRVRVSNNKKKRGKEAIAVIG